MSLRPSMMLLIILCVALVPAYAGAAMQVNGSVLYGAGQYRAEVDGEEVEAIASQYGQVALSTQMNGVISDARIGKYTLMLGYEFNVLNPTSTYNSITIPETDRIEKGKVLYQGEVVVAPGGLPFRIHAYSRDIHRTSFTEELRSVPLPVGIQPDRNNKTRMSLLTPEVMTNIEDGTHHEVGAMLILGIRNGSYLGNYRDVLSQLPRLLVDYKQIDVRDLSRDWNQKNYRSRDLAFISLNKKDNWVHFRLHEYKDFIDPTQDYNSTQVMIGTIDHVMNRQWINLTNWIKISGDLSYNVEKLRSVEFAKNIYRVNLFAIAQRQELKTSVLSSFERTTQGERLTQEIDLPIYFNYEPNRDSYYRGRLYSNFYRRSTVELFTTESDLLEDRRVCSFDLNSELFRTGDLVFRPGFSLAVRETLVSQDVSEKLRLEISNQRDKSLLTWTAGGHVLASQGSNDTNTSGYLEESLFGNVERKLLRSMRTGLRATVTHGSGKDAGDSNVGKDLVKIRVAEGRFPATGATRFISYDGLGFWEHLGETFLNRLELSAAGMRTDVETLTSAEVQHILQRSGQLSKFTLTSALTRGSSVSIRSTDSQYLLDTSTDQGSVSADLGWSSKAEYRYTPDRRLSLTLFSSVRGLVGEGGDSSIWQGSEKLEYRFFKSNGTVRKIAEVMEEFGAEWGGGENVSGHDQSIFLRLKAAVYPTKYLYAKVASELVVFDNSEQMTLNGETGLNFDKLQVALSYGRGYKAAEELLAEVKEETWNLKVKKVF